MKITPNQASYRPCFTAYEKTFVMLKPDAINRHLDSKIMDEIKSSGLTVLTQWNGTPTRSKMEGNYITHRDKFFFKDWIDFLVSGKIKAMVLGGEDAVARASTLKKSIRSQYAPGEKRFNLIHSSDDVESAKREIANFFDTEV